MEPSDNLYQVPNQLDESDISPKNYRVQPEPPLSQDAQWLAWIERLKQSDPGRQQRQEIAKFGDWVDHMGDRMSCAVQDFLEKLRLRR